MILTISGLLKMGLISSFDWYFLQNVIIEKRKDHSKTILITDKGEIEIYDLAETQINELIAQINKHFRIRKHFGIITSIILSEDHSIYNNNGLTKIFLVSSLSILALTCLITNK